VTWVHSSSGVKLPIPEIARALRGRSLFDGRAYVAWMTGEERAVPAGPLHTPGGFHSFEHRWALADAFALQAEIGQDRIAARVHELAGRLRAGLAEIRGVRLRTPADAAGIVCCELDGVRPGEAVRRLRDEHRVIASVTPYATEYVRFGTGLMVDEDDVDAAVAAVRALT